MSRLLLRLLGAGRQENRMPKQRCTFMLSPDVLAWIEFKAKKRKVSRSQLVEQLLKKYSRLEKEKQMVEGYKALRDVIKATAEGTFSAQREVVPNY